MNITAKTIDGSSHTSPVDRYHDLCPVCHANIYPMLLASVASGDPQHLRIQSAFLCTRRECQAVFVGTYLSNVPGSMRLATVAPKTAKRQEFQEVVAKVSPTFVEIYNQCLVAEAAGLGQLTGIGLRKALEFLVKDYLVDQTPADKEAILGKPLAACIKELIKDPNIQQCAERATWLGNDETHYLRVWDKDVEYLKILIGLTVNWVANVLLTRKIAAEMPKP